MLRERAAGKKTAATVKEPSRRRRDETPNRKAFQAPLNFPEKKPPADPYNEVDKKDPYTEIPSCGTCRT